MPGGDRGDTVRYSLVARRDTQRVELELPVRLPYPPPTGEGRWLDTGGFERQPERWVLPGEVARFRLRGEVGLRVWIEAREARFPLSGGAAAAGPGIALYQGEIDARELRDAVCESEEGTGGCKGGWGELVSSRTDVRVVLVSTGA